MLWGFKARLLESCLKLAQTRFWVCILWIKHTSFRTGLLLAVTWLWHWGRLCFFPDFSSLRDGWGWVPDRWRSLVSPVLPGSPPGGSTPHCLYPSPALSCECVKGRRSAQGQSPLLQLPHCFWCKRSLTLLGKSKRRLCVLSRTALGWCGALPKPNCIRPFSLGGFPYTKWSTIKNAEKLFPWGTAFEEIGTKPLLKRAIYHAGNFLPLSCHY